MPIPAAEPGGPFRQRYIFPSPENPTLGTALNSADQHLWGPYGQPGDLGHTVMGS